MVCAPVRVVDLCHTRSCYFAASCHPVNSTELCSQVLATLVCLSTRLLGARLHRCGYWVHVFTGRLLFEQSVCERKVGSEAHSHASLPLASIAPPLFPTVRLPASPRVIALLFSTS